MHEKPYIATPCMDGKPFFNYVSSLVGTAAFLVNEGVNYSYGLLPGSALIDNARNQLLDKFLKSDCDCIIWIDADIGWHADDFMKLLKAPYDCIGGIYPKKTLEESYPVELAEDGETTEEGYRQVSYLPGGFTKFSRDSIEKVEKLFGKEAKSIYEIGGKDVEVNHFYATGIGVGGKYCGEDVAICNALRTAKYKLYVDPSIELTHAGTHLFKGNYGEYLERKDNASETTD